MPVYALTLGTGPGWDAGLPRREQPGWDAHAAFMDELAAEGFVVLGGPIGDGDRVLLVVEADDVQHVHDRLAADPWTPMGVLSVERVERWEIWLDGRRSSR